MHRMRFLIFFIMSLFLGLQAHGEFRVQLVDREPTAEDANPYMLEISGKTDLGPEEMLAFQSCVLDFTVVKPTLGEDNTQIIADLKRLTETKSVAELNGVLKQMTCQVYRGRRDNIEGQQAVTLTTPSNEGLDELIDVHLTECLRGPLDESIRIPVSVRNTLPPSPEEQRRRDEEKYCR